MDPAWDPLVIPVFMIGGMVGGMYLVVQEGKKDTSFGRFARSYPWVGFNLIGVGGGGLAGTALLLALPTTSARFGCYDWGCI